MFDYSSAVKRCNAVNSVGCEIIGCIAYPKCKPGFVTDGIYGCKTDPLLSPFNANQDYKQNFHFLALENDKI